MSRTTINAKEFFSNYLFHSREPELSKKEKIWITITSAMLGVLTLGLFHIASYIATLKQKVSVLDRDSKKDLTTRIDFLACRLKEDPKNEPTLEKARYVLEQGINELKRSEKGTNEETKLKNLNDAFTKLKEDLKDEETLLKNVTRGLGLENTIKYYQHIEETRNVTPEEKEKWDKELNDIMEKLGNEPLDTKQIVRAIELMKDYYIDDKNERDTSINDLFVTIEKNLEQLGGKEDYLFARVYHSINSRDLVAANGYIEELNNSKNLTDQQKKTLKELMMYVGASHDSDRKKSEHKDLQDALNKLKESLPKPNESLPKQPKEPDNLKKQEKIEKKHNDLTPEMKVQLRNILGTIMENIKNKETKPNRHEIMQAVKLLSDLNIDNEQAKKDNISGLFEAAFDSYNLKPNGLKEYLFAQVYYNIQRGKFTAAEQLLEELKINKDLSPEDVHELKDLTTHISNSKAGNRSRG